MESKKKTENKIFAAAFRSRSEFPFTSSTSLSFFLCSRIFRRCDLMFGRSIVLTKCTTWPQKHTTWTFYLNIYHPHDSSSAFWSHVQSKCCKLMLHSIVLWENISVCGYDWLFSFPILSCFFFFVNYFSTLYVIYGIKHPNSNVWNLNCGFLFLSCPTCAFCVPNKKENECDEKEFL